jgi:hypothetical protein
MQNNEAQYFIEQYAGRINKENTLTGVLPISILKTSLDFTKLSSNLYTVCIFKIKLKNP